MLKYLWGGKDPMEYYKGRERLHLERRKHTRGIRMKEQNQNQDVK